MEHNDGSQEIVEIINDLGLDKKNYQSLLKKLEEQGVQDIKKASFTGAV